MIHERLWELTHRRPYQPFRIRMTSGHVLEFDGSLGNRCVVLPTRFVVAADGRFRFHDFTEIAVIEELQAA